MIRALAGRMSAGGHAGRLSVLIFHRVLAKPDELFPGEPDVEQFGRILSWLRDWFQVLPLDEAGLRLANRTLPPRAAAITFDDGYADNVEQALPVLLSHRMSATFFIASEFVDGGMMWNDKVIEAIRVCTLAGIDLHEIGLGTMSVDTVERRRAAIDQILVHIKHLDPAQREQSVESVRKACCADRLPGSMMTVAQLRRLHAAGMLIGAHTCSHPILTRLPDDQARSEILGSKAVLEDHLQAPVTLFAYPNGRPGQDYAAVHVQMVRDAGFAAAVSTAPGAADPQTDLFQLPRFTPWDRSRLRFGARLLSNLRTDVTGLRR